MAKTADRAVLYTGTGLTLTQYDIDVEAATLTKRGTTALPASAQYAWQHSSKKYFYVATSDGGSGAVVGAPGKTHRLCAFSVDPSTGALRAHGAEVPLAQRPIHMTLDKESRHALVAYNTPSTMTIHRIRDDGTLGEEVKQAPFDGGIYAHQVRVMPSGSGVILVTRGFDATSEKPEDPGALRVFRYHDGVLGSMVAVAPNGGFGFGPRHIDFHPTQPWVYVSLERQNKMQLFHMNGDTLEPEPRFSKDTLRVPGPKRIRQLAGTLHVHPNGRFVYGCERSTKDVHGQVTGVYDGGENTIVVYAIDQRTGEPTAIQHVDTRSLHPRTFSIHPSGRLLIVGGKSPVTDKTTPGEPVIPAGLDVFRVGEDGKLDFVRKYDVDVCNASMFWSGLITL